MTYTKNETGRRMAHSAISKFLATVLSAALVFVSIPVYAFAADPVQTPESYAELDHGETAVKKIPADAFGELVEKRNENGKYIRMTDGTEYAVQYPFDVHFADGEGFSEYDNTLIPKEHQYVPTHSDMEIAFSANTEDGLFSYGKDGYTVSVSIPESNFVQAKLIDKEPYKAENLYDKITVLDRVTAGISYEDVLPGINLTYTLYGHDVKEEITLLSHPDSTELSFLLSAEGMKAELAEDGGILLSDADGNPVFSIPTGYLYDAAERYSDDVEYSLSECDGGYLLNVLLPEEFLAEAQYPVTVDPTLTVGKTENGGIIDTYTVSEQNQNYGNAQILYCGNNGTGENKIYLKLGSLPTLPGGAAVVGASVCLVQASASAYTGSSYFTFGALDMPSAWQENTLTAANAPSDDTQPWLDYAVCTQGTNGIRFRFDVTESARNWYAGVNNGVIIKGYNTTQNTRVGFCSAQSTASYTFPAFEINYRDAKGLDERWSYASHSAGNAGAGSVNLFGGNLVFVHKDIGTVGNLLPVTVSHVYNLAQQNSEFSSALGNVGIGWKLSAWETIREQTIGDTLWLIWTDADGTELYFRQYNGESGFLSEDGYALKIQRTQVTGRYTYSMTDDAGNEKHFNANGYLEYTRDTFGNKREYIYDGTLLKYIRLVPKNKPAEVQLTLTYDHNTNYLTQIENTAAGTSVVYSYTDGNLTKIENQKNEITDSTVEYTYDSNGKLLTAYDSDEEYRIQYQYDESGKIVSLTEYGQNTAGQTQGFTFDGLRTSVRTSGNNDSYGDNDDIVTEYLTDVFGRTVCVSSYICDASGKHEIIGVETGAFNDNSSTTNPRRNNTLDKAIAGGRYAINLLKNSSFETSSVWSGNGTYTTDPFLGNKALSLAGSGSRTETQTVSLPAGTYTLSAYIKTLDINQSAPGTVAWIALDGEESVHVMELTDGWRRVSVTKTLSAGTHTVSLKTNHTTTAAYALFDCVQLEKADAPSSYNLIEDADFNDPAQWSSPYDSLPGVRDQYVEFSGGKLILQGQPRADSYVSQTVRINRSADGLAFLLSGWASADSAAAYDLNNTPYNYQYLEADRCFEIRAQIRYTDSTYETFSVYFHQDIRGENQFSSTPIIPSYPDKTVQTITVSPCYDNNVNEAKFENICLTVEDGYVYTYDENGNVTGASSSSGSSTSLVYSGTNLSSVTSGSGSSIAYTYNSNNSVATATDANNVTATYTYDAFGNITKTETKYGSFSGAAVVTQASYSSNGNLPVSETNDLGKTTTYGYNANTGFLDYVINANGKRTSYLYDAAGRMTDIFADTNANGVKNTRETAVTYQYNAKKQLSGITTGSTVYSFTYDGYGNMTSVSAGNTVLASYTYAPNNGKLLSMTYADGTTVTNTYDALDRIASVSYNNSAAYTVTYDGNGNISSYTDHCTNRVYHYEYDAVGRLAEYYVTNQNTQNTVQSGGMSYDSEGRTSTYRNRIPGITEYRENYAYDTTGRLSSLALTGSLTLGYTYDILGRLDKRSVGTLYEEKYTYTANGSNTSVQVQSVSYKSGSNTWVTYTYTYDNVGNITSVFNGTEKTEYTYDELNQLTSETVYDTMTRIGTRTTWAYDDAGNITTKTTCSYNNGVLGSGTPIEYHYDSVWGNKLTSYDGHTITYDANGNPISYYNGQNYTFTWQKGRELASVTKGGTTTNYAYGADGLRSTKTIGGTAHNYYYSDGGKLLYETWSNQALIFQYDESGSPVGIRHKNGNSYTQYYFVKNLQGDILQIRNASGNIVAKYAYDAWGKLLSVKNASGAAITDPSNIANINPIRYRGYYYDTETGFYYLQSRYYDPQIGRFLNADSVDYLGVGDELLSFNLFAYCGNNPVLRNDSEGTLSWKAKIAIGVGVIAAAAILTVATGGAAAGTIAAAVNCFATGALEGAISGAISGAVSGAATEAVKHRITSGSWDGVGNAMLEGAADGFMSGSITGFISGGLTSNYCFAAGTAVLTSAGSVLIEDIKPGDLVWATDTETGETELKEVVQLFRNETDEWIHLTVNDEEIVCTPGHPFYSPVKGWTKACQLRAGDILVTVNGEYVVLEKIQHELLESPETTYNFEVEDFHTYYVGEESVLVHNKCSGSYEIEFQSGKNYVGKGSEARMKVSAKIHSMMYNDPVTSMKWDFAPSVEQAFVDEYFKMAVRGVNNPNTYNLIWSPGRSIFINSLMG